jgi:hypothetical protein
MLCTKAFYRINIFHIWIQIFLWSLIYCPFFSAVAQRFLPSEFGDDPERRFRMKATDVLYVDKIKARNAIKAAGIPYTFVSSNCFAGLFLGSWAFHFESLFSGSLRFSRSPEQQELKLPRDKVTILGNGNAKGLSSAHPFVC